MRRVANYHSHLALCGHATGVAEDYVKEAIRCGYEEIGISDHAPIPEFFVGKEKHHYLWLDRMMTRNEFFDDYLVQLDDCIKNYGKKIHILKGLEIEYLPNHDPFYQKLFSYLDYFNLGIHYFNYNNEIISPYDPLDDKQMDRYAEIIEEALTKGWFSCLVHPDLYLYNTDKFTKHHEEVARRIIEACIKNDVYLEINANGENKYPRIEFWNIVKEYKDAKIIINSDAHCVENFHGENIKRVMKFAEDNNINVLEKMELKPHKKETLYIGHRGASGVEGVVNNCKSGFLEGIKRDYFGLECDVRVTTDNVYYIHHDSTFTLSNNNFVKEDLDKYNIKENDSLDNYSWNELKDLRLYYEINDKKYYDHLILFEDYIKLCKESHIKCIVELKRTNGINEKDLSKLDGVFEIINKYDMLDNTIIISFMKEAIEYVKEHYKCYDIALLTGKMNTNIKSIEYCIKHDVSIDAYYPLMTKKMVELMHKNNLTVNVWTMNDKTKEQELKIMNIDYFTTDVLGR